MQLLIAHGDPASRAAVATAITEGPDADLELLECGDGEEALHLLLNEGAPRLAVVDWDMPGIDGLELCRLVRDFHLDCHPYIVLLASEEHPAIEEGLEAGANDCVRAPAPAAELRERIGAGRRFVELPWGQADRGPALDAVPGPPPDDDDDEPWDLFGIGIGSAEAPSRPADAAGDGRLDRTVRLQAVLGER